MRRGCRRNQGSEREKVRRGRWIVLVSGGGEGEGWSVKEEGGEDSLLRPAPVTELSKQEVHHYLSNSGFNQLCSSVEDRFNIKAHFQSH